MIINKKVSFTEAAELLGVSRDCFVSLLNDGKIPFHMVNMRKIVYQKDVEKYLETQALEAGLQKINE